MGQRVSWKQLEKNTIDPNGVSYPSIKCDNICKQKLDVIKEHVIESVIDQGFINQISHGEIINKKNVNPLEMMFHKMFIRTNHMDEVIEIIHNIGDEFKKDINDFKSFLKDVEKTFYYNCKECTRMYAIVSLYNLKSMNALSDKYFKEMLKLFGQILCLSNELSLSMYKVKKSLSQFRLDYKQIYIYVQMIAYFNERSMRIKMSVITNQGENETPIKPKLKKESK